MSTVREDFVLTVGELRAFLADKPDHAKVILNVEGHAADAIGHVAAEKDDEPVVLLTSAEPRY